MPIKTRFAFLTICLMLLFTNISGQRIAVINADDNKLGDTYIEKLKNELSAIVNVTDTSFSRSVLSKFPAENKLNLTKDEAKQLGETIGCDLIILVKVLNHPRNAFGQKFFYEATAAIFVISTRSGLLEHWQLDKFESETEELAEKALIESINARAKFLADKASSIINDELRSVKKPAPVIYTPGDVPAASGFRPPMPYRQIKPEYTMLADLFAVKATVDAEVDIDETGNVSNISIVRWAGYGLDESVKDTIRKMNWRHGEQNGKPLAMRILLRYNFIKVIK